MEKNSFKRTDNKKDIIRIINDRLLKKILLIQLPSLEDKFAEIAKATDEGIVVVFKNYLPPDKAFILTGFIEDFYCEIELIITDVIQKSIFLCDAVYLRISSQRRMEPRYSVKKNNDIFIKRIKISSNEIAISNGELSKESKLLFKKYEKQCRKFGDIVQISPVGTSSKIHQEVLKTGKTYYLANINRNDSFVIDENSNEDLINLKKFYGESLSKERRLLLTRNIIGRIVLPILGSYSEDIWEPIGLIDIASKKPIKFQTLMQVKSISLEIVNKLQELNVIIFDHKFKLLDISRNGLCLLVDDEDLVELMIKQQQFNCYIMIKGNAPIIVDCWIRSRRKLEDGSMLVGVKLQIEDNRHEQLDRYWNYIENLQAM